VLDEPEVLRNRRGYQQAVPVVDCGGAHDEVGRERNREEELALEVFQDYINMTLITLSVFGVDQDVI
jgi:hypothetical protein